MSAWFAGAAALTVIAYWAMPTPGSRRRVLVAGTVFLGVILSAGHLAARRLSVLLFFLSILLTSLVFRMAVSRQSRRRKCLAGGVLLVLVFLGLKAVEAQRALYARFRIPGRYFLFLGPWLGASYLLFRLLHVLIEASRGELPRMRFSDLLVYALFPPSLIAGPIDRFPRFRNDMTLDRPAFADVAEGLRRLLVGIFKKFVVADFLSSLPLDYSHGGLSPARMWATLYLFGFRFFFDFAGYSDMAIGAGRLLGFRLPENFDVPYGKRNLTQFWQSWHATLSGWMRDYVFFPLGRLLRRRAPGLPREGAALLCFVTTMVLIGLWHGLEARFALWGAWHGLGLFAVWWFGRVRVRDAARGSALGRIGASFLTFQFVMVGWVFFYGDTVAESLAAMARLTGRP